MSDRYATRHRRTVHLLVALGVGLAILQWGWVIAAVAVAVLSTVLGVARSLARPDDLEGILGRGLAYGSGVVAWWALATASPVVALLVGLLVVGTSPRVVRRLGRGPARVALAAPVARLTPDSIADLTTDELCRLWRGTFWELQRDLRPEETAGLVRVRAACLDELAHRDPAALQAWLDSGARPSEGPERFWSTGPHPGPVV